MVSGEGVEDLGDFDRGDAAGCGEEKVVFGVMEVVGGAEGRGGGQGRTGIVVVVHDHRRDDMRLVPVCILSTPESLFRVKCGHLEESYLN